MPIDPLTATAIGATAKWMWDSYGKTFVDGWAGNVGGSREKKQLEKQWQEATQTYLEKLYDQVNWLRLLGKKEGMPLERIYTDLNVLDQPTAEKYYDRALLEEDFVQRRSFHARRKTERQDGLDVAKKFERLYILGKPGAGKTTFMKFMTLEALRGKLGQKIPIFVTLKELSDKNQAILLFMAEQFKQCGNWDGDEVETPLLKFITKLLRAGQAVVLFDGLDEVNLEDEKRAKLINELKAFVNSYEKCQVLVTCRIAASDYSFARFKYVEMADFNEEQQQRFIFKWFQDDMARRDACWQALSDSKSRNLRELAYVPLLLTLLCITYERRGEFPPDRDEVYRTAVNALLFEWDSSRLIKRDPVYEGLDVKYRERLLAWIAFETFSRSEYLLEEDKLALLIEVYLSTVPRIDANVDGLSVLKTIEAQHGLLVERAQNVYSFSHLTLQEYFTARYVAENAENAFSQLMEHVGEDSWGEVFLLTVGMLYRADSFVQQYISNLIGLIVEDKMLTYIMEWAAEKNASAMTSIQPAATRAFFLYLLLEHTRVLNNDRPLGRISILARDLAVTLDSALEFDIDRASSFDNVFTPSRLLEQDRSLTLALALDLAVSYDLDLMFQLSDDPFEMLKKLSMWSRHQANLPNWLRNDLNNLEVSNRQQLEKLLLRCWGLNEFLKIDKELHPLLHRYLTGAKLLVECLTIATVSDRAVIEGQLLLPPQ
ncbi:MAG: NACHT domain-containing protein [Anaerolineales bacterium]|nr:NACHT domain-containing protein [Anaerolineales bacterium]